MDAINLVYPVFVQVALTFVLMVRMARARIGAVRNKDVKIADIALDSSAWPKPVLQASNAFHNQLQLPVLFYVLVLFAFVLNGTGTVMLILAWIFALSRLWHAWVHVTHNHVPTRFNAFAIGVVALISMWLYLALKVTTGLV